MKKMIIRCLAVCISAVASQVAAQVNVESMLGLWEWECYKIRVERCEKTRVCAQVLSGPENVGLQMIRTRLIQNGNTFVGKIAHPMTGEIFNAKLTMANANIWYMDGCTENNVCTSSDFIRVRR